MKTLLSFAVFGGILIFALWFAQNSYAEFPDANKPAGAKQPAEPASDEAGKAKPKMNVVKTTDFHLRDGKLVSGKLLDEDQSKIVIEELGQSCVNVVVYPKNEVEPRTIRTVTVPEYKYYIELGEHFAGKTWDFKDDTDEFIQAIRCYESAKQSLIASQIEDDGKIAQIDQTIVKIKADREVWTKEMETRARLKKLEFDSEFEKRFNALEDKVNTNNQQVKESMDRISKQAASLREQQQNIERDIASVRSELARELSRISSRTQTNRY